MIAETRSFLTVDESANPETSRKNALVRGVESQVLILKRILQMEHAGVRRQRSSRDTRRVSNASKDAQSTGRASFNI